MNQTAFDFDPRTLARRSDPETSHAAARKVTAFGESHAGRIYDALRNAGDRGATYREIAQAAGMEPVAVARRMHGMEARGLIGRTVEKRGGCVVWTAVNGG